MMNSYVCVFVALLLRNGKIDGLKIQLVPVGGAAVQAGRRLPGR